MHSCYKPQLRFRYNKNITSLFTHPCFQINAVFLELRIVTQSPTRVAYTVYVCVLAVCSVQLHYFSLLCNQIIELQV